ncbi:hypothetical protein P9A14_18760 [Gordonia hongkongensis]|uniref:TY-Chap C-terminal domain-containing protein n=1 Tax=Gordonia hongkongensis TaxID=1701090 RepID=A0AAX3T4R2_9ACTN|nr:MULTISPECIES: hypothetical protein [Gordonia]MCZ4538392.1 hypothetical protein [Gordonia terrae]MCT1352669.1 hypothetical protein [Gordonia sp. p3-SID1431]MDF6100776.1 hypothetical protein [Gordonia hongkongensis]OCH82488.1 hypothetical protein A9310_13545 [Gordonia sp. UCD-TK1]QIK46837.1 hypothetical protein G8C36_06000 [Gordonia terrae]
MRYRSDLERLATLDAAAIEVACTDCTSVGELIDCAVDEYLEFDVAADEAEARGHDEHAAYLRQEAAAWRATVRVLRMIGAESGSESHARDRGRHGAA